MADNRIRYGFTSGCSFPDKAYVALLGRDEILVHVTDAQHPKMSDEALVLEAERIWACRDAEKVLETELRARWPSRQVYGETVPLRARDVDLSGLEPGEYLVVYKLRRRNGKYVPEEAVRV